MKLQAEYDNVKTKAVMLDRDKVAVYKADLEKFGECKDVNVRLAWDILRGVVGTTTICQWYTKYNCNDKHIETLAIKVCKDLQFI